MIPALDAVIDAALERALVDTADARRYFALAGALERVRRDAIDGSSSPDGGYDPDHSAVAGVAPDDALGAALVSTAAARALLSTEDPEIDPDAWGPGEEMRDADLVAAGAAAACRRLDTGAETVAARAGIPRERLRGRVFDE